MRCHCSAVADKDSIVGRFALGKAVRTRPEGHELTIGGDITIFVIP